MHKTDVKGFYKVEEGIVINRDNEALQAYKKNKTKLREIDSMKKRMEGMEDDLSEIKNMLKKLINDNS